MPFVISRRAFWLIDQVALQTQLSSIERLHALG
jgi:hypothetical protein